MLLQHRIATPATPSGLSNCPRLWFRVVNLVSKGNRQVKCLRWRLNHALNTTETTDSSTQWGMRWGTYGVKVSACLHQSRSPTCLLPPKPQASTVNQLTPKTRFMRWCPGRRPYNRPIRRSNPGKTWPQTTLPTTLTRPKTSPTQKKTCVCQQAIPILAKWWTTT